MGNSITDTYLDQTYFELYQGLRNQLMDQLADADLETRLGGETETLGVLCRAIGETEHSYVESLRTFRQDFDYRNLDPRLEHSVSALRSWYDALDRDLAAAIAALTEEDIEGRQIVRGDFEVDGFTPGPKVQLDIYREALLIFYGKASVYLKAMGKPFTSRWHHWIG